MENKISKLIMIIIVAMLIACIPMSVFADGQLDLGDITGNTAGNTTDDEEEIPDLGNTITGGNNTVTETPEGNTTPETPSNTAGNNTSTYEESDIPYAGPAETMLMVSAFVVFGIIGVYTFIKMSDYSNI